MGHLMENRQELFEQVAAIFAINGMEIDDNTREIMRNFLDGKESYEEFEARLEAMIAELEDE